jgi:Mu-like prophage protein Com
MPRIRLPIINKPKENTRTVLTKGEAPAENQEPFISGEGDTDLGCGQCDLLLARGIEAGQIENIVLHCPRCGGYNNIV